MLDVLLIARDAVLACVVGMLVIAVAPILLGWTCTVVVSGSMEPGIHPGDVVSAAPIREGTAPPTPGTVVLVADPARPGELLVHRLRRYDDQGRMILKGDANRDEDSTPVPMDHLRGTPRLRVPVIGRPYVWIEQGRFLPAAAFGLLVLLLAAWQPKGPSSRTGSGRRPAAGVIGAPLDADYRYRDLVDSGRR
ncbi:S26 family signal peptidase [Actinoplanes sp. LDG1-06]|uniref:S26 family signal peptidase n=1 Tax=Paractinoplanes ovalisporus TaxID=2810368 RepID=A0ABS2A5I6_9ACTN|nr:S26 family signal peptidase [Actinoplanes ovalisporus]MBM2615101.1 S26 family signal peptidase [Actinoplanes ovalisporus]